MDLNLTDDRWKEIRKEFFEVQKWAREDMDSHLRKRVLIRTIAAGTEGQVNMLAYTLLSTSKSLSAAETSILNEVQYELKDNGDTKEKDKYYSCVTKWRLIVKIIERHLGTSHWQVDFANNDFNNFKTIFKVRNRITHPKIEANLNIEDTEMNNCLNGYKWFITNYQNICKIKL